MKKLTRSLSSIWRIVIFLLVAPFMVATPINMWLGRKWAESQNAVWIVIIVALPAFFLATGLALFVIYSLEKSGWLTTTVFSADESEDSVKGYALLFFPIIVTLELIQESWVKTNEDKSSSLASSLSLVFVEWCIASILFWFYSIPFN